MPPDASMIQTTRGTVNPITAEIIRYGLLSIPNQIDVNITRTAYSPLVYEYKDYAVGIVDPEGRLISQSQGGIPLFVANALGTAVLDGIHVHGLDGIAEGDVLFSNHAGTLGQHAGQVSLPSVTTLLLCVQAFGSSPLILELDNLITKFFGIVDP